MIFGSRGMTTIEACGDELVGVPLATTGLSIVLDSLSGDS
jgi:hypothetical protein